MKIKRQAISGGETSGMTRAAIEREKKRGVVAERGPKITGIGIDTRIVIENGKGIGIQRKMGIGSGIGSTRKVEEIAVAAVGDVTGAIVHTVTNMTALIIVMRKTRVGKKRGRIHRMPRKGIKNVPLKTRLS